MAGYLEEERDHRGNVGPVPGKWSNFSRESAHLRRSTVGLPLSLCYGTTRTAGEVEAALQREHGPWKHASVLGNCLSVTATAAVEDTLRESKDCENQQLRYICYIRARSSHRVKSKLMTPPARLSQMSKTNSKLQLIWFTSPLIWLLWDYQLCPHTETALSWTFLVM